MKEKMSKLARWKYISSVQLSHSVMSDSLKPQNCSMPGLLVHCQLPESTQTHVHCVSNASNHLIFCRTLLLPSASGSFPMSQLFASVGQSIGDSASASVLSMNIQGWFLLESRFLLEFGLISLLSKGLSRVLQHHSSKASSFWCSAFVIGQLSFLPDCLTSPWDSLEAQW